MMKFRRHYWIAGLMLLALAAVGIVLAMTRQGVGLFADDCLYFHVARTFSIRGIVSHPPLYGFALGLIARMTGSTVESAAIILNAVMYPATLLVLLSALCAIRPQNGGWILLSGLVVLLAYPLLFIHAYAASEPLFLLTSSVAVIALCRIVAQSSFWACLWVAAIAASMAFFTRYAGVALVLYGGVVLLLCPGSLLCRSARAVAFGVIAILPVSAVMVINRLLGSASVTGREVSIAQVWSQLRFYREVHLPQLCTIFAEWFMPYRMIEWVGWLVAGLASAVVVVAVLVAGVRQSSENRGAWCVLCGWPIFYMSFVIVWVLVSGGNELSMNHRILSPVALWLLPLFILSLIRLTKRGSAARLWVGVAVVLLTGVHAVRAVGFVSRAYREGVGFNSVAWRQSPTLRYVLQQAPHVPLYTNAPEVLRLLGGVTRPRALPWKLSYYTGKDNPHFAEEMEHLRRAVKEQGAQVVIFRLKHASDADVAPYRVKTQELIDTLGLTVLRQTEDGLVLGNSHPSPTS